MKILYISHLHPPKNAPLKSIGGMQRVSMQLVKELKSNPSVRIKKPLYSMRLGMELKLGQQYFLRS